MYKLHGVRVYAADIAAAADFYSKFLGLSEVARLSFPGVEEILMNFGDSTEAATANSNPLFVIMNQQDGVEADERANILIHSNDIEKSTADMEAAGGSIIFGPLGADGVLVAFVKDPFGNTIEFIQLPEGRRY